MLKKGTKILNGKVKYPIVKEAFSKFGITLVTDDQTALIVWFDGTIPSDFFLTLLPHQRLNKIPGMDFICFKSNTFSALNSMRAMYPKIYTFFPLTFLIPFQYSEFQHMHIRESNRLKMPATWIVKPRNGCCGNGIKLIQNSFELSESKESCIVQNYIRPFLVDGFKFDFRFYLCISTMEPFTAFIYNEGIARFCTKKYSPPTRQTLSDKYAHLTNTAVNVTNENASDYEFTQFASSVIAKIKAMDPRGEMLWDKIKSAAMLTLIGIYTPTMTSIINNSIERKTYQKLKQGKNQQPKYDIPPVSATKKYFHILGIDVLLRDNLEPIVLELNDRPSMHVTFDLEEQLKPRLIYDTLSIITTDGSPPDQSRIPKSWEQILPVQGTDPVSEQAKDILEKAMKSLDPQISIMKNKSRNSAVKGKLGKQLSKLPPLHPSCQ